MDEQLSVGFFKEDEDELIRILQLEPELWWDKFRKIEKRVTERSHIVLTMGLKGLDFTKKEYEKVSFSGLTLRGCDFSHANLAKMSFKEANLEDTSLVGARLNNVSFERTKLAGTNFRGALLSGANFTNADFKDCLNLDESVAVPYVYLKAWCEANNIPVYSIEAFHEKQNALKEKYWPELSASSTSKNGVSAYKKAVIHYSDDLVVALKSLKDVLHSHVPVEEWEEGMNLQPINMQRRDFDYLLKLTRTTSDWLVEDNADDLLLLLLDKTLRFVKGIRPYSQKIGEITAEAGLAIKEASGLQAALNSVVKAVEVTAKAVKAREDTADDSSD